VSPTTFLVIERDAGFLGDGSARFKNVYAIDISGATNVDASNTVLLDGDPDLTADPDAGLLVRGRTLEASDWNTLAAKGIVPVSKRLVYDALAGLDYPHDKLEGLWILDATRIALLNDDDFAVVQDAHGNVVQKYLPGGGVDAGTLYIVELHEPLH
jgi:hypothetical protein